MTSPRYVFDRWGTCIGYLDDAGRYFNAQGRQLGHLGRGGKVYDDAGAYRGRFDVQGQYWNEYGACLGYLSPTVRVETRPAHPRANH